MRRSLVSLAVAPIGDLLTRIGPFDVYKGPNGVFEILAADAKNKLNLLDDEYYFSLYNVCDLLTDTYNAEARVAIFGTKEGYAFTGGTNLNALAAQGKTNGGPVSPQPAMRLQRQHTIVRRFQDCVSSLALCRVPVLAAMDRYCIGGGTSIATACDLRYCTVGTTFSVKEAQVGLAADIGVLQRLPGIVGEGRARELAFTARAFKGDEAKQLGFVEEVYPDYAAMMAGVRAKAAEIASNSPLAVQGTKHLMNWHRERQAAESLAYTAAWNAFNIPCDDVPEARKAFLEKRPPHFENYMLNPSSVKPLPPTFKAH